MFKSIIMFVLSIIITADTRQSLDLFGTHRVIFLGDSTSRYEYESIVHTLLETNFSANLIDPMDTDIFKRLPPWGNENLLPAWAYRNLSGKCNTSMNSVNKWGPIMVYNHGVIGDRELCDCSPGTSKMCCYLRLENRIFHIKNMSYVAYIQLLGDEIPIMGSLDVAHLQQYALYGTKPNTSMCPAGVARPPIWLSNVTDMLKTIYDMKPTHLVLNIGHWVQKNHTVSEWWESIARSGLLMKKTINTTIIWRTHPILKHSRSPTMFQDGKFIPLHALNNPSITNLFMNYNWSLYDAAQLVEDYQGNKSDDLIFAKDKVHLSVNANNYLSRTFMKLFL